MAVVACLLIVLVGGGIYGSRFFTGRVDKFDPNEFVQLPAMTEDRHCAAIRRTGAAVVPTSEPRRTNRGSEPLRAVFPRITDPMMGSSPKGCHPL